MLKTADYTYQAIWSPEDSEYVGLCHELQSLSWLARAQTGAIRGIRNLVDAIVLDMNATGEPLPPLADHKAHQTDK